jgi:hypothetical protein
MADNTIKTPSKVVIIPRPTTGGSREQGGDKKTVLDEPEGTESIQVETGTDGNEALETGPKKK